MSSIKETMCKKLESTLSNFVNGLELIYTAVSGQINTIKTFISGMQYSTQNVLNNASDQIKSDLNDVIPDFNSNEFDELTSFINACTFLKNDKTLGNPLTTIRSVSNQIKANANSTIDNLTSTLQEFSVAKLLDSLFVQYEETFDLITIIPNIYQIMDCMDRLCNTDITSTVQKFEGYVDKLYLLTNGKFDTITFFSNLNLSTEKVSNINIALTSYYDMRSKIANNISNGVDFAKSLL